MLSIESSRANDKQHPEESEQAIGSFRSISFYIIASRTAKR